MATKATSKVPKTKVVEQTERNCPSCGVGKMVFKQGRGLALHRTRKQEWLSCDHCCYRTGAVVVGDAGYRDELWRLLDSAALRTTCRETV